MNNPLVSIVIPTYNRAAFLPRTLSSVFNQTYKSIEIIVCDNASTDKTSDVIADFQDKYPDFQLRYICHDSNIGPTRNWFSGITESKGDYLKILFSDDFLYPCAVESLLQPLMQESYAFSYGKVHNLWKGSKVTNYGRQRPGKVVSSNDYIKGFFSAYVSLEDYPKSPCAALFRTAALRKIPLDEYVDSVGIDIVASGIGPDMLMFLYSFLFVENKAVYVDELVAAFEGHKDSITVSSTMERLDNHNFAAAVKFYIGLTEHCEMKQIFETEFNALATGPGFYRRPRERLELLMKGSEYILQPRKPPFPLLGISLSLYRRCCRALEYRLGLVRNILAKHGHKLK